MAGDHTYISNINIVIVDFDYFFLLLLLNYNLVCIHQCHVEIFHVKLRREPVHHRSHTDSCSDTEFTSDELSANKTDVVVLLLSLAGQEVDWSTLIWSLKLVLWANHRLTLVVGGRGFILKVFRCVALKEEADVILCFS